MVELKQWMKKSWLFQQQMFQMLCDRQWDQIDDDKILKEKLSFALMICFGEGKDNDNKDNDKDNKDNELSKITNKDNDKDNKDNELSKITNNISNKIDTLFKGKIEKKIAFTFISLLVEDKESTYLVIWIMADEKEYCVDLNCREYKNWNDFIENNVLPKCKIMYPVNGKYHSFTNDFLSYYIDIILDESVACSSLRTAKKVLDVASSIGFAGASVVLMCNPVTGPIAIGAGVGAAVTGAYNVGSNVVELIDVHKHEGGINLTNSKSLVPIGEIALTTVGSAAMGAGLVAKSIAAEASFYTKLVSGNSLVFKVADSAHMINRIVCISNIAFNVVVVVNKYLQGTLEPSDIKYFGRILLFGFNLYLTETLLQYVIGVLSKMVISRCNIIASLLRKKFYECVKRVTEYVNVSKLQDILNDLFPRDSIFKNVCNDVISISKTFDCIISKTELCFRNKKFITPFMLNLFVELSKLAKNVTEYRNNKKNEIINKYDEDTWTVVDDWLKFDGIDYFNGNSEFDNIINTPFELEKIVNKTVKECFKYQIDSIENIKAKETLLFSTFMKMIKFNKINNSKYIINKLNYYSECFNSIFSMFMESHFYEYFLYKTKKDNKKNQEDFFKTEMNVTEKNILEFLFKQTITTFEKNEKYYNAEFELKNSHNIICDKNNKPCVYTFKILNKLKLTKKDYYLKAKCLIPTLNELIDEKLTIFEQYFGGNSVVIRSKFEDNFTLYFYLTFENNDLNGMLVRV